MATSEGQGVEAHQEEKGHTWVNASCSQTQVPGRVREVHTGRTQGTHRIAGMRTPWSAAGTSCVALGEVQSLSPHVFIVWCIAEAAYAVRLSSAVHYTRSMAIQFPQEIYYAFVIFNEYKVGEPAKGNSLAYFLLRFKIWKLSLFFLTLQLFSRGCKALLSVGKSINLKTENCLCLTLPYK